MPPRFAYWTIILDNVPTSFRTKDREEILPLFNQLKAKNPGALLKWFSGGAGATLEVPARTADQVLLVPGQAVTIAVGDGEVLRAAATVYLPPLAGLLLGATAGTASGVAGDAGTLLAAAVGGLAGWGIARVRSRRRPPVVSIKLFDGEPA